MGGSYMAHGGVEHAKTMLAYHRDGKRTATALVVFFAVVVAVEIWMLLTERHPAYGFGAGVAAALTVLGVWLHIHHGKKVARWEARLEQWERLRRDRLIHARHLKGFEL